MGGPSKTRRVQPKPPPTPEQQTAIKQALIEQAKKAATKAIKPFERAAEKLKGITQEKAGLGMAGAKSPKPAELRIGADRYSILIVPKGAEMEGIRRGYTFAALVQNQQVYSLPGDKETIQQAVHHSKGPKNFVIVSK